MGSPPGKRTDDGYRLKFLTVPDFNDTTKPRVS